MLHSSSFPPYHLLPMPSLLRRIPNVILSQSLVKYIHDNQNYIYVSKNKCKSSLWTVESLGGGKKQQPLQQQPSDSAKKAKRPSAISSLLALPFPHKILKKQVPKNFGKNCLMREKRENRATRPSLFDACERIIIKSNSTLLRVIPK